MRSVVKSCRKLQTINLEGCRELSAWAINEASPYLEHLTLGSCTLVNDIGIGFVTRACTYLRTLCIRLCRTVTNRSLEHIAQHCCRLEKLDVWCRQVTDGGLEALSHGCRLLTSLELEGYAEVSDKGLTHLAEGCPNLTSSTSGLLVRQRRGVVHLAQSCSMLTSLDLRLCSKVTSASVAAVARFYPRLTAFYLERAGRVTDVAVKSLAEGCRELAVLDLGWCEIGDGALAALSSSCLHTVSLAYCEAVTDDGLDALCRGCVHLAGLDIGGCSRLTRLALHSIASHCPQLLSLDSAAASTSSTTSRSSLSPSRAPTSARSTCAFASASRLPPSSKSINSASTSPFATKENESVEGPGREATPPRPLPFQSDLTPAHAICTFTSERVLYERGNIRRVRLSVCKQHAL